MARTAITAASIRELSYQHTTVAADEADLATEAGDDVNGNDTPCTGKELIVVSNTDVGAQTVTFTAAPDEIGRAGSISAYSVGAGELAVFGPFSTSGWRQSDDKLYIDVSDATVEIGVLRIP
jgi:hypothetical protein